MLKLLIAMLIGAAIGAAVTHELMTASPAVAITPPDTPASPGLIGGSAPLPVTAPPASGAAPLTPAQQAAVPIPPQRAPSIAGNGTLVMAGPGGRPIEVRADPAIADAEDFDSAFSYALGLRGDPAQLQAALGAVASRWLIDSPEEAIAALDRLTARNDRLAYIQSLVQTATAEQPALLGDIAARLRGAFEYSGVMIGMMQATASMSDPAQALDAVDVLPPMLARNARRMIYMQMAQRDPDRTLALIEQFPPGQEQQELVMSTLTQLAMQDPSAALRWLDAQTGMLDASIYSSLGAILGQQAPELAAQHIASIPESARAGWVMSVSNSMASNDPDAALHWLSTYQGAPYYADALAGVVQQLAIYDPVRAAPLIAELEGNSLAQQVAVSTVAGAWAASNPDAALGWVRGLPAGSIRDAALSSVAPVIGEAMLTPAMLDLFSDDRVRGNFIGGMAMNIAVTDLQRAQELIETFITDSRQAQLWLDNVDRNRGTGLIPNAPGVPAFGISSAVGISPTSGAVIVSGGFPQFSADPPGSGDNPAPDSRSND